MFAGKVAIVTGAAHGIGKATAVALAKHGSCVVIVDIDVDGGQQTAQEVQQLGISTLVLPIDVADSAQVNGMVDQVMTQFGRVDMLVNNAYISGGYAPIADTTDETWNRVLAVNLTGYFNCARAAAKVMMAQRGGAMVNLSSGRSEEHTSELQSRPHLVCRLLLEKKKKKKKTYSRQTKTKTPNT